MGFFRTAVAGSPHPKLPSAAVSPHPKPTATTTRLPAMAATAVGCSTLEKRKLPVLLFDVMDTIVRDPFYHDIPAFFKVLRAFRIFPWFEKFGFFSNSVLGFLNRMSMRELLEEKHPTAWLEFEKGLINETELAKKFFKDGRPFDLEGLKECMYQGYSYLDGIEEVLLVLRQNNYELHAFTNYPVWYNMIEQKLKLSKYLSWTFSSCIIGKRKPSPDSYMEVVHHLKVEPSSCVFIDDRLTNVEAAMNAGMIGIHFKSADSLKQELSALDIELAVLNHK